MPSFVAFTASKHCIKITFNTLFATCVGLFDKIQFTELSFLNMKHIQNNCYISSFSVKSVIYSCVYTFNIQTYAKDSQDKILNHNMPSATNLVTDWATVTLIACDVVTLQSLDYSLIQYLSYEHLHCLLLNNQTWFPQRQYEEVLYT